VVSEGFVVNILLCFTQKTRYFDIGLVVKKSHTPFNDSFIRMPNTNANLNVVYNLQLRAANAPLNDRQTSR